MPAVQLAELLAELADVEADMPRQPGPVGVALLDAHVAVLQAHEDLRVRVGIERRLEPDLELARVEVVTLNPRLLSVGAHVPRHADLRVELSLVALAADEPVGRGVRLGGGVAAPGGGPGGAPERRELVRRRRVFGRWGDPSLPPGSRERGPHAVEPHFERADLRRERIHLLRRGLLRLDRSRAQARERGHYGESVSDHAWTSPVQCVSRMSASAVADARGYGPESPRGFRRQETVTGGARGGALR